MQINMYPCRGIWGLFKYVAIVASLWIAFGQIDVAAGTSIYVDCNRGNDATGNGSIDAPFATIQKGISVVADNAYDEVIVAAGIYNELIRIQDDKRGMTLRSAGDGEVIVRPIALNWYDVVIMSPRVTIQGITFDFLTGSGSGNRTGNASTTGILFNSNSTITQCTITSANNGYALYVNVHNVRIEHNVIRSNAVCIYCGPNGNAIIRYNQLDILPGGSPKFLTNDIYDVLDASANHFSINGIPINDPNQILTRMTFKSKGIDFTPIIVRGDSGNYYYWDTLYGDDRLVTEGAPGFWPYMDELRVHPLGIQVGGEATRLHEAIEMAPPPAPES